MARPRMTRRDYYIKYNRVLFELQYMIKSMRAIARDNKVGLSTVMRLKKKFLWGKYLL